MDDRDALPAQVARETQCTDWIARSADPVYDADVHAVAPEFIGERAVAIEEARIQAILFARQMVGQPGDDFCDSRTLRAGGFENMEHCARAFHERCPSLNVRKTKPHIM